MPSHSPTIVVVEDDASMSKAIGTILRAGGFTPLMFASAEAALELDVAKMADCLVLDIMLPGMSGFDLYRRLAFFGADVPAIFITAHDEAPVREEAERIGPNSCFIPKPFSGRTLLEAVAQALGRQLEQRNEDQR